MFGNSFIFMLANDRHVYLKEKNIVGELSSTLSGNGLVPLSVNWYNL